MGDVRVGRRILTSGDVAKIMCVAPRTVSKWCDSGRLRGWRLPGLATLAPAAPLVVLGAGSLSCELHDDGWRCLPGDAGADEVAREILGAVREG